MVNRAYTKDGEIWIPEKRIKKLKKGQKTEALRGYGFIWAVFDDNNNCIGWIAIDDI